MDEEARALVRRLAVSPIASLGTLDPASGHPAVSRVTVIVRGAEPVLLVSDLSHHTTALSSDPRCSLLLGEPGPRGDPLTHPRVTVFGRASRVPRDAPDAGPDDGDHAALRETWLAAHPKARLYVDFADFAFWRVAVDRASLNGGFGKAFEFSGAQWREALAGGREPG